VIRKSNNNIDETSFKNLQTNISWNLSIRMDAEISETIKATKGLSMQIWCVAHSNVHERPYRQNLFSVHIFWYIFILPCQKFFNSDRSLKSYKQIKRAILETDDLLHAYLHLPRTTFNWLTGRGRRLQRSFLF